MVSVPFEGSLAPPMGVRSVRGKACEGAAPPLVRPSTVIATWPPPASTLSRARMLHGFGSRPQCETAETAAPAADRAGEVRMWSAADEAAGLVPGRAARQRLREGPAVALGTSAYREWSVAVRRTRCGKPREGILPQVTDRQKIFVRY